MVWADGVGGTVVRFRSAARTSAFSASASSAFDSAVVDLCAPPADDEDDADAEEGAAA